MNKKLGRQKVGTFAKIADIRPEEPTTWKNQLFLTLDFDWASDEVLEESIFRLEQAGAEATWFVTHATPIIERLRENPRFELGIHPNFNFLLEGQDNSGSAEEVVESLLELVPEAVSVRSHSMLQSSRILQLFRSLGLKYDCNHFIPAHTGIVLRPWVDWNGMIRVPYFWEDDVAAAENFRSTPRELVTAPGLRVIDFHPIHIALNTRMLETYERARPDHGNMKALRAYRDPGPGTSDFLDAILGGEMAW